MFTDLLLAKLQESATNPRKAFDKDALAELTTSVKEHGVLQPILVRYKSKDSYEVVAGARRFRAAKAAGLKLIPCVIRELDDKQVLEIQIIENLQRKELHPIEEARGYGALVKEHGYTVERLAAKVGKSPAYIYSRLKLSGLPPKAQELFLAGRLDVSRAILIGRIPTKELAEKCATEIADDEDGHEIVSYRHALDHVQREYMLRLDQAPFDRNDEKLVPAAGTCGACPKRTGNQKDLWGDVKGADICTDTKCFAAKVDAHWGQLKVAARQKGTTVVEGKEADRLAYDHTRVGLDDKCYEDGKTRTYRQLLGKDAVAELSPVLARTESGQIKELVPKRSVQSALQDKGYKWASASGNPAREEQREEDAKHRARLAAVLAATPDLVKKVEGKDFGAAELRWLIAAVMPGRRDELNRIGKRRGVDLSPRGDGTDLCPEGKKAVEAMKVGQLRGLLVELIATTDASSTYIEGYGKRWKEAVELWDLDMRKASAAARAEKPKKAKAKAPGK